MRYDQPFFVPFDKRNRFRGLRNGYLPALEEPLKEIISLEGQEGVSYPLLRDEIRQLKGNLLYIEKKLWELQEQKKRPLKRGLD